MKTQEGVQRALEAVRRAIEDERARTKSNAIYVDYPIQYSAAMLEAWRDCLEWVLESG